MVSLHTLVFDEKDGVLCNIIVGDSVMGDVGGDVLHVVIAGNVDNVGDVGDMLFDGGGDVLVGTVITGSTVGYNLFVADVMCAGGGI